MKTIFERSVEKRKLSLLPECDVPAVDLEAADRETPLDLPEVSENDISRHFSEMAKSTHGVNDGFYPLGSCTMFGTDAEQDISLIPSCVYTSPEIASVGMTKEEAKSKGIEVKAGKYIMSANGKSVLSQEDRGFIKIIADAGTGVVLGGQIMSGRATDMIGELALAVAKKLTVHDLASVVAAHPTFSEGIREAAASMI